jgi:hypothetical protein
LLSLDPFGHKIWEPHDFEIPLGDPPRGETVSDNFPQPILGHHTDRWLSKEYRSLLFIFKMT